jgi:hypothetical protein
MNTPRETYHSAFRPFFAVIVGGLTPAGSAS